MPLLNYSTTIDHNKTAGEIEYILSEHGARSILKNYTEDGHVESLDFIIVASGRRLPIHLPINAEPVFEVLKRQKAKGAKVKLDKEQAERVAWRILKDWVEAQMAIIETEMVKFEQVFLPYITNAAGQTFYEVMEQKQFLLGEGKPHV